MDNQHRQISGYRELSQIEIDAMNAVKSVAENVGSLMDTLRDMPGIDARAPAIAKTELQTGFMWATRAVAQPETF